VQIYLPLVNEALGIANRLCAKWVHNGRYSTDLTDGEFKQAFGWSKDNLYSARLFLQAEFALSIMTSTQEHIAETAALEDPATPGIEGSEVRRYVDSARKLAGAYRHLLRAEKEEINPKLADDIRAMNRSVRGVLLIAQTLYSG